MSFSFSFRLSVGPTSERLVRFRALLPEGLVRLEALDGQKPALLDIPPSQFPWANLAHQLVSRWQKSLPVPLVFRPQQRIPPEVLEFLITPGRTDSQILEVLRTLRKAEFLPAIKASAPSSRSTSH